MELLDVSDDEETNTETPQIVSNTSKDRMSPEQLRNFQGRKDEEIAERIFKGNHTLTTEEIFEVSPAVKKALICRTKNSKVQSHTMEALIQSTQERLDPSVKTPKPETLSYFKLEEITDPGYDILLEDTGELTAGSIVHRDIVDQFRKDRSIEDQGKKIIIVSRKGESLRVIYPQINKSDEQIECVLDSGSQIVSMDTNIAVGLGIAWDPDVVIHMQSANGNLSPTRGLARNIPFRFGDIVVYLQVHIIDDVPYQVLMGRPFDVLVESEVWNTKDGGQLVTITDPNSGRRSQIGTYAKGEGIWIKQNGPEKLVSEESTPKETPIETSSEAEQDNANFTETSRNC